PDKHENSQAHLPDLRGVVDSHTAAQANLRMAQKFITFSIANFQMPIANWILAPKIGKCRGALLCEPPCLCGQIQKCERVSPVADTTPATFACRRIFASLAE